MKRYNLHKESWWEGDYHYFDAEMRESRTGQYVKYSEIEKLNNKIKRMQNRIDTLEGRK